MSYIVLQKNEYIQEVRKSRDSMISKNSKLNSNLGYENQYGDILKHSDVVLSQEIKHENSPHQTNFQSHFFPTYQENNYNNSNNTNNILKDLNNHLDPHEQFNNLPTLNTQQSEIQLNVKIHNTDVMRKPNQLSNSLISDPDLMYQESSKEIDENDLKKLVDEKSRLGIIKKHGNIINMNSSTGSILKPQSNLYPQQCTKKSPVKIKFKSLEKKDGEQQENSIVLQQSQNTSYIRSVQKSLTDEQRQKDSNKKSLKNILNGRQKKNSKSCDELSQSKKPVFNLMRSIKVFQSAKYLLKKIKSHLDLSQKEKVLDMINDSACDFQIIDEEIKQNYWKLNFFEKMKLIYVMFPCIKKFQLGVLSPDSNFRLIWDIIQVILITSVLVAFSIAIVFDLDYEDMYFRKKEYRIPLMLFFLLHIFLNFNTGFYIKGVQEFNRAKIFKQYFGQNLVPDVLALIPMVYNGDLDNKVSFAFEFFLFFKLFTVIRIFIRINNVAEMQERSKGLIKLIKLWLLLFLLAHIESLMFFSIGALEYRYFGYDNTWLHKGNLLNLVWWQQYIRSFYWSTSSMITVVVYDPVTIPEIIICCIIFLLTTGLFGYSINVLGEIMNEIYKTKKQDQKQISTINRYMNKKKITYSLRIKVRKYLDYIQQENLSKTTKEESEVIECLSQQLREEILKEERWKIIQNIKCLYNNFTEKILQRMMYEMEEIVLSEGEIIYLDQQVDDYSLYYIDKGGVELYYECIRSYDDKGTVIKSFQEAQQSFGEYAFFTGTARQISARSTAYTTIYKIKRLNFIDILEESEKDFEMFHQMKDELLQSNKYDLSNSKCTVCGSESHIERFCPDVHYEPNKKAVLYHRDVLVRQSQKQHRSHFQRLRQMKQVNDHVKNMECMLEFREENTSLSSQYSSQSDISSDEGDYDQNEEKQDDEFMSSYPLQKGSQLLQSNIQEVDEEHEQESSKQQQKQFDYKRNKTYQDLLNSPTLPNKKNDKKFDFLNEKNLKLVVFSNNNNNKPMNHSNKNSPNKSINKSYTSVGGGKQQQQQQQQQQKNFQKRKSQKFQMNEFNNYYDEIMQDINQKFYNNMERVRSNSLKEQIPNWVARTFKENQLKGRKSSVQSLVLKQLENTQSLGSGGGGDNINNQLHHSSSKTRSDYLGDRTEEEIMRELRLYNPYQSNNNNGGNFINYRERNQNKNLSNYFYQNKKHTQIQQQQQQPNSHQSQTDVQQFKKKMVQENFDYIHEYKYYFPYSNASVIIEKLAKKTEENLKKLNIELYRKSQPNLFMSMSKKNPGGRPKSTIRSTSGKFQSLDQNFIMKSSRKSLTQFKQLQFDSQSANTAPINF